MSDTGRDGDLIPDATKDNYRALRVERGQTWTELAADFRRSSRAGAAVLRGDALLASWAEAEAERAGETQPAKKREPRKQVENAPRPTSPQRTAVAG